MPTAAGHAYDRRLHRVRLENGVKVLLAPNPAAPVVAVQAWVGVGSADEPRKRAGIAHVMEHMLFKGSAGYGVGQMARAVESAGGEINAWTSFDQTVFHVVLSSRHFDTAVDVLADALQRPTLDADELEREREVILEEIRQTTDDPMRTVAHSLFATAFTKHPYRHPVIGTPETVMALRRRDLEQFLRTWYVANNLTLVIAGDVDPVRATEVAGRAFGAMPARELPRRRRSEPVQAAPRAAVDTREVHDAHVAIGFHVPELIHEHAAALDIGAIVMGQGESSRLAARVRREQELVTSAHAYAHTLRERGLFVLSASVRADQVPDALEALCGEVERMRAEPPSSGELDKARHAIRADAIYQRETAEGVARKLGYYETMAGDFDFEAEILRRVHRLGAGDVADVVGRYLHADNASLAVLLPHAGRLRSQRGRDAAAGKMITALRRGFRPRPAARVARARLPERDDLVREVLPNGIRVIVKRDASVPVVALRAAWQGGARYETPRTCGITNLLAATITSGCNGTSAEEVIERVDDLAGTLVGVSGRNSFGLRSEWLAGDWERGFDLMARCLAEPRFEEAHVDREKRRMLDDINARGDNAGFVAFTNFARRMFRRHPYRLPVGGTEASVSALTRRRVLDFYRRHYPIGTVTLTAVGDIDPDRLLSRAAERLGGAPARGAGGRDIPSERWGGRSEPSRRVLAHMDREQAHLVVGFPGLTIRDPDRAALEVLMTVLGGQGGRLFAELRDKRALAYRVSAFSVEGIDPGYLAAYIACSPEKLDDARAGIRGELERVARDGVDDGEIDRAVRYLVGAHEIALQRRASLSAAICLNEAYGIGHDYHLRYGEEIEGVTASEVKRVARQQFDWDAAVTSIVTTPATGTAAAELGV